MMRRNSFFFRLLAGNLVLVLVTVVLGGVVAHRLLEREYQTHQQRDQRRVASLMQMYFQTHWNDFLTRDPAQIDAFFKQQLGPRLDDLRITLLAPDGTVLADSSTVPADQMENHATDDRPEVLAALAGREAWDHRASETLSQEFNYYATPLRGENSVVAALRVAMPVRVLSKSKQFIRRSLGFGAIAALAVTIILGVWLSWMWTSSLRQLTQAADQIASGDLGNKVYVTGAAELSQLADALNEMRQSLAAQMETISEQRANLQTVVGNLDEAIVATDLDDRIVLANEVASYLFTSQASPLGQNIQQVVRIARLVDTYRQVQQSGQAATCSFHLERTAQRLSFTARISPVEDQGSQIGFVMVVRDITEMIRTMEIKSQFVVNASHELRTPLATVRAAVDSLDEANDPDEARHLQTILNRQVRRLEELTRDLLAFSSVEDPNHKLNPETIPFQQLAQSLDEQFTPRAREKNQEFHVELAQPETILYCDRRLLEMILQNLIDNAMKYTPDGGAIDLTLRREDGSALLSVSDNGVGIETKDQARVFERFYQADPSRTGDIAHRGTGLGLAIVKHAAERLGASVNLKSTPGKGTTVTIQLPISQPPAGKEQA